VSPTTDRPARATEARWYPPAPMSVRMKAARVNAVGSAALLMALSLQGCRHVREPGQTDGGPDAWTAAQHTRRTLVLRLSPQGAVAFDNTLVGPIARAPENRFLFPALAAAIRALPKKPGETLAARVEVAPESDYDDLALLLYTAGLAGVSRFEVRLLGDARVGAAPGDAGAETLVTVSSSDGCVRDTIDPRITLTLVSGKTQRWITGHASFIDHQTHVPGCGTGPRPADAGARAGIDCEVAFKTDGPARNACLDGRKSTTPMKTLELGGPAGCLVPPIPLSDSVAAWTAPLTAALASLGLEGRQVEVVADLKERNENVVAIARALEGRVSVEFAIPKEGRPAPTDPPRCEDTVRTHADLRLGAARWLGTQKPAAP